MIKIRRQKYKSEFLLITIKRERIIIFSFINYNARILHIFKDIFSSFFRKHKKLYQNKINFPTDSRNRKNYEINILQINGRKAHKSI